MPIDAPATKLHLPRLMVVAVAADVGDNLLHHQLNIAQAGGRETSFNRMCEDKFRALRQDVDLCWDGEAGTPGG